MALGDELKHDDRDDCHHEHELLHTGEPFVKHDHSQRHRAEWRGHDPLIGPRPSPAPPIPLPGTDPRPQRN